MTGWLRALLFLIGVFIAAAVTAYFTGLIGPFQGTGSTDGAPLSNLSEPAQQEQKSAAQPAPAQEPEVTAKQDRLIVPTFDLLRVEPDGSVVIAGKAAPDAKIEILLGDAVLADAKAGAEGDFAAVFDKPLKPGDYQLSLRATAGDEVVMSAETAIVSIPETPSGEVLALVEEPGQPAQLITVPQATDAPGQDAKEEAGPSADETPAGDAADNVATAAEDNHEPAGAHDQQAAPDAEQPKAGEVAAPAAAQPTPESTAVPAQPSTQNALSVDAVEIEGDTIFVAGQAAPGLSVRVYADDILLGDARVSEGGRFLVETKRDLPVGNYVIRADVLGKDGRVVSRAAVPFEREPGESIAAIAPQAPAAEANAGSDKAAASGGATADASVTPVPEKSEVATAAGQSVDKTVEHTAPALQRAEGAVIIRRGDSLWRISRRVYGRGVRYSTIYLANQDQIADPDRIWPGQVFAVPSETSEGEPADMSAIGDQSVTPEAEVESKP